MIPKKVVHPELESLIHAQDGVFTLRQCEGLGGSVEMLRRLVRDGRFHRVANGLYCTTATPSWSGLAWGGLLLGCQFAVLGGRAAAHLYRFGAPPDIIDVWTPARTRVPGPWRFRRGVRPGRGEPVRVSPEDAALEVAAEQDPDAVEATLLDALRSRHVGVKQLRIRLAELPNLRHRVLIDEILSLGAEGVESVLEAHYLRLVEKAHRLPAGTRQVSVSIGTRSDVAYLELGVLVELDGRLGHEGTGAFRDADRDNAHALEGWVTLRFGWRDVVRNPCRVARLVAVALQRRGWTGDIRSCRRCG
ncbi:MAG TPA: type IV toxin-antitoxin system AbiEi family antitoxin domain-containing protein [Arachnia sp.]|nr:type IV toxin-antitoxin system AbiEi family antitoxin domain-containing protein [Arachnia sp.]HMT85822.1 type IV toxin-antitoxin system AbiEi family antitoxin domain-containing protein [Arachnia sp.]